MATPDDAIMVEDAMEQDDIAAMDAGAGALELAGPALRDMDNDELLYRVERAADDLMGTAEGEALPSAISAFGITNNNLLAVSVEHRYQDLVMEVWRLHAELISRRLEHTHDRGAEGVARCSAMRKFLLDARDALARLQSMERITARKVRPTQDEAFFDLADMDRASPGPYEMLHNAMLKELSGLGYRKRGDLVYEQIILDGGVHTRAWRSVATVEVVVRRLSAPERNPYISGLSLVHHQYMSALVKDMLLCESAYFPWLKRDRHVSAWRNGLFMAETDELVPWDEVESRVAPEVVASKWFDAEFEHYPRLRGDTDLLLSIPCPAVDQILSHQEWGGPGRPKDLMTVWALLGRFLYDLREHDEWELFLLLQGFGGCGKSTLIQALSDLYEPDNVGTLGNSVSQHFGIAHLCDDKFIVLAPDVNGKFGLEQTTLFSMVSGEAVTAEEKYRTHPIQIARWTAPIAMSSNNHLVCWGDVGGNQARRTGTVPFRSRPKPSDPTLKARVRAEMAAFVVKANRIYRYVAAQTKGKAVEEWLPKFFRALQRQVQASTNTLHRFLDSCDIEYGMDFYCPVATFMAKYGGWRRVYGIREAVDFSDLYRDGPFAAHNVKLDAAATRPWPPGSAHLQTTDWVVGCRPRTSQHSDS